MSDKILKLLQVKSVTGRSGSSIYRDAANGTFPTPIKLGARSSGWLESEVEQWLNDRIEASRTGTEG